VEPRHRPIPRGEHNRLAEFLKAVRLKHGGKQAEICGRLGRPQSYLSRLESGEQELRVLELIDICRAMGIDPARFLEEFLGL